MTVYTYSEARQRLATLLDQAEKEGGVRIRRKDGREFELSPVQKRDSPLAVEGAGLDLTAEELISAVRETRERFG